MDWSGLSDKQLRAAFAKHNRLYHDEARSEISDGDYDRLREEFERRFGPAPAVPAARGKVRLPYVMASLNKPKRLDLWTAKHPGPYIVSDKLDGISAMVLKQGDSVQLLSRGDGLRGQDLSHILPHIRHNLRAAVSRHSFAVRGELVRAKDLPLPRGYSTARNLVGSVATALRPSPELLAEFQLVYYAVYELDGDALSPAEQFAALRKLTKKVVWHAELSAADPQELFELLRERKAESEFELDGLVLISAAASGSAQRNTPQTRRVENPKHAVAFKDNSLGTAAETEVLDVEWNVSKDFRLKPTVLLRPVVLDGVSVQRATGFNARFIRESGVGPGAVVRVVRSGDVIPFLQEVLQSVEPSVPAEPHLFDGVDYVLQDRSGANVPALVHFFKQMGIGGLQEGTVQRLVDAGHDTVPAILKLSEKHLRELDGFQATLARKVHTSIQRGVREASLVQWMAASNLFRGLGERKLRKALEDVPDLLELPADRARAALLEVPGFAQKSADALVAGLPAFRQLMQSVDVHPPAEQKSSAQGTAGDASGDASGEVYVFSGFRSAELRDQLLAAGRRVEDSVTKRTTHLVVKDASRQTVKMRKAAEQGVCIVSANDLEELLNNFSPPRTARK